MNPAMWISKTGVQAQDAKLQAIANNLANVNTVGYKRDRVMFEDLFYQVEQTPGAQRTDGTTSPTGTMLGNGTRLLGTQKVFTTGNLQNTGQALDVAIVGSGFLQVAQANGDTAYTRAGQLQVNADGRLVTMQGLAIVPEITVPNGSKEVTISESGVVSAIVPGATAPSELGQLQIAGFVNPAGLRPTGENLFAETAASGTPAVGNPGSDGLGKLKQGSLEASNVQVVEEMVEMIAAQRSYEMNTKVLSAADNMLQTLAQAAR